MNFRKIITDGYGKLAEKLPERDKGFLEGWEAAIEELTAFEENLDYFIKQDAPTLRKAEEEYSKLVIENIRAWLKDAHDENLVSFVDNNHYSIDEDGNIVDDGEEK